MNSQQLPRIDTQKQGFPWNEESDASLYQDRQYAKLSIVVPSYNQGHFIEETLRCILLQNYPNLELIVMDGGSTDETIKVLETYNDFIDFWISEKDDGQSDAINKGLKRATGDWLAFMNSDDGYLKDAFSRIFTHVPTDTDFIYGNQGYVGKTMQDAQLRISKNIYPLSVPRLLRFFKDVNNIIPSQSVFFSRKLIEEIGFYDQELHYGMDFEWYVRAALTKPKTHFTDFPTYFYRLDEHAKTAKYHWRGFHEVVAIARKYARYLSKSDRKRLEEEIAYDIELRKVFSDGKATNFTTFKDWFLASPKDAIKDRRYWGMVKKHILKS
ncbi:MAG: glycosyltransferase family 2 protein [Bacteroidota bacterium]